MSLTNALFKEIFNQKTLSKVFWILIVVLLCTNINLAQQYWGEEMFPTYSESLVNGEVGTLYTAKTVDVENDKMYVAERRGVTVVDISDPTNPQIIGEITTPEVSRRIVANNNILYIIGEFGLTVVDVANPNNPTILYYTPLDGTERGCDIVLSDSILFVSSYTTIYAYDVSVPASPSLISSKHIWDPNFGIHITKHPSRDILYCGVNNTGRSLYVIDVSEPSNMNIITNITLNGGGTIFSPPAISKNRLFVIETIKIHAFDITDPSNPTLLYSQTPSGSHYSFVVNDSLLFAAHQQTKWVVYSIINNTAAQYLTEYSDPDIWGVGFGIAKLQNNYLYLLNYGRNNDEVGWNVKIVDISDPLNASIVGTVQSQNAGYNITHTILKRGNKKYALVAQENSVHTSSGSWSYKGLLRVLDITDPFSPILISTIDYGGRPLGIEANDSIAVVLTSEPGSFPNLAKTLNVFAITNLDNPIQTQAVGLPQDPYPVGQNSLRIFEGKLYVLNNQKAISVYQINSDYTISLLGSSTISSASLLFSIQLRRIGSQIFAYLAAGSGAGIGGFLIVNATNPSSMYLVSAFDTPGAAIDIALQGNYAFVSDYVDIWVFDISNNTTTPLINMPIDGEAWYLKVLNNLMFINVVGEFSFDSNIKIFDISNPASPIDKGTYLSRNTNFFSISEDGREFYLVNQYDFSIKRPLFNFKPSSFNLHLPLNNSSITSDTIEFVWDRSEDANDDTLTYSLRIWNSTFDTTIVVVEDTSYLLSGSMLPRNNNYNWTVKVSDGEFEVASVDTFSFYFTPSDVDIYISPTFSLEQNYPNPFNPITKIKYSIPSAGNIKLSVYNLLGEEVAVLVNGHSDVGVFEVIFDASNLASGVYLYKLQSANSVITKKLTLIK